MRENILYHKFKRFIGSAFIHLVLLPFYFILSSYVSLAGLFGAGAFLWPMIKVTTAVIICFIVFRLLYKHSSKAAVLTTVFSLLYLFFGNIKESLSEIPILQSISHYKIFIPLLFAGIILFAYQIKKIKKPEILNIYLNLLLLIYITIEVIQWGRLTRSQLPEGKNKKYFAENKYKKQNPDIFYIVLDGYPAGSFQQEKAGVSFNLLDTFLNNQRFQILRNPRSNYNYTAFSTESVFRLEYVAELKNKLRAESEDYSRTVFRIKNAVLFNELIETGYILRNYSIFDIPGNPSFSPAKFFFVTTPDIIFENTFWNKIKWDILPALFPSFAKKLASAQHTDSRENIRKIKKFNQRAYDSLWETSLKQNSQAEFIYTHLEMPHSPYLYDSSGKEFADSLFYVQDISLKKSMYKQYIAYVNTKVIDIIKNIQESRNNNAVIIIQSDHGCRESEITENKADAFRNYSAFFFPDRDYSMLYDSMSNVNTFRIILNKYFGQQLPLLKDSSIYLKF